MTKFKDELTKMAVHYEGVDITEETVRKLTEEQQGDLISFSTEIASSWLERQVTQDELSLFLYAFTVGHDWCKDHWALW